MDTDPAKPPFEAVVCAHSQMVLRVCRAVVGADDAEDAWTETFLAALSAYPSLPPDANVEAWLVTIAHRKAIDLVKARGRRAVPVDDVPNVPSSLGVVDLDQAALWAAVKTLPQATPGGRLSLRRRPALRADRRDRRRHSRGSTARRRRRHHEAANPVSRVAAETRCPSLCRSTRVVRNDGALGGYLGGAAAKTILLDLERAA